MVIRKKIKIDKILDGADLKSLEDHVLEQERLARRAETAQAKIRRQKNGGIFASKSNEALPSAFVRRQRKKESLGLAGGRHDDSLHAKGTLSSEKIRPVDAEYGAVESLMARLGVKKYQRRESKDSLVSSTGRPVRNFDSEFTKLRGKVNNIETTQKGLAQIISKGQVLVGGAQAVTSVGGLTSLGLGAISHIPIAGMIAGIAVSAVAMWWQKHTSQYAAGGTRDARKKIMASDTVFLSTRQQDSIFAGDELFFSDTSTLQGLPVGNSNTMHLRDGISKYSLRHQGSYE